MDIRERAKENLRSAIIYYQYRPHGKFDIINRADYNTKSSEISHSEWLALYAEVIKEPKESKMKHLANKEPWQMTKKEYVLKPIEALKEQEKKEIQPFSEKIYGRQVSYYETANYKAVEKRMVFEHKQAIQQALSEGKIVPPEVLEDYPNLKSIPIGEREKIAQKEVWDLTLKEWHDIGASRMGYKGLPKGADSIDAFEHDVNATGLPPGKRNWSNVREWAEKKGFVEKEKTDWQIRAEAKEAKHLD